MALTLTKVKRPALLSGECGIWDVTFSSSYPTGGESLTNIDLGFKGSTVTVFATGKGAGSRHIEYDPAAEKLKLYTGFGTEAANASDQSSITARIFAIGDRDI